MFHDSGIISSALQVEGGSNNASCNAAERMASQAGDWGCRPVIRLAHILSHGAVFQLGAVEQLLQYAATLVLENIYPPMAER